MIDTININNAEGEELEAKEHDLLLAPPPDSRPCLLTGEEADNFLAVLSEEPCDPTPRMQQAVKNYERIMGRSLKTNERNK